MSRRFKNLSLLLGPLAVALVPLLLLAQPPLFNYAPGARQATRQVSGVQAPTSVRGSAAFSPTDIAGLQIFYDARRLAGFNDGDAVATVSDLSGNSRDATQGTASKRPLYKTNVYGSDPALLFDGVDDALGLTNYLPGNNYTMVAVFSGTVIFPVGGSANFWFYSSPGMLVFSHLGYYNVTVGALTSKTVMVLRSNAGTVTFRKNAVDQTLGSLTAFAQTPSIDGVGFANVSAYHNGHIGAVLLWNTALTDAQIVQVEGYLQ